MRCVLSVFLLVCCEVTCCELLCVTPLRADACGSVAGNLVTNCGFETETLAGWTLSGTDSGPAYDGIAHGVDGVDAHSGTYGAYLGGFGGVLSLSQTITTIPGVTYSVSYWFAQSPATIAPYQSSFSLSFGGSLLTSLSQVPDLPFTQYTVSTIATSTTANLLLGFRDDTGLFSLDDVVVTSVSAPEPASFAPVALTLAFGLLVFVLSGKKRAA